MLLHEWQCPNCKLVAKAKTAPSGHRCRGSGPVRQMVQINVKDTRLLVVRRGQPGDFNRVILPGTKRPGNYAALVLPPSRERRRG